MVDDAALDPADLSVAEPRLLGRMISAVEQESDGTLAAAAHAAAAATATPIIGMTGTGGAGKSSLLRIMAGVDTEIDGEARPQPGIKVGFLPQEPQLNPAKDVRGNVEDGVAET